MKVNDDSADANEVGTGNGEVDALRRRAFGRDASEAEREAASHELSALGTRHQLRPRAAEASPSLSINRRPSRPYVILSLVVSVMSLGYGLLVHAMYSVHVLDAPYLAHIPVALIAPFEAAAPTCVIGGLIGVSLAVVGLKRSAFRLGKLSMTALSLGIVSIVVGIWVR